VSQSQTAERTTSTMLTTEKNHWEQATTESPKPKTGQSWTRQICFQSGAKFSQLGQLKIINLWQNILSVCLLKCHAVQIVTQQFARSSPLDWKDHIPNRQPIA